MDASEQPAPRRRVTRTADLPHQRTAREPQPVHVPEQAPAVPVIPPPRRER